MFRPRIPQHDIRIRACSNRSLLRIHAEDTRWRRRRNLDKPLQTNLSRIHTEVKEQLQPILHPGFHHSESC